MLKQKYFLADIFILSAEKQPIKLSWRKIECLHNRNETFNKENIKNIIVRNGIPYIIFYLFCFLLYHLFIVKNNFNLIDFLGGLINAPGYNVKNTTGFVFLWFLPVFMLMSLFKIIGKRYKILMILFFIIGFIICVNKEAYIFMWHSPFYILKALFYYAIGISAYYLNKYLKHINLISVITFIILSILYFADYYQAKVYYISLLGFFSIIELTSKIDFNRITLLSLLGKYSLPIYLIHVFVYNVLEIILPYTFFWGIVIYILTIILSLVISICIYKIEIIRKLLFPKSWDEWIHFYQTTRI